MSQPAPTPEDLEDWDAEELEQWNRAKEEDLREAADEDWAAQAEQVREAKAALRSVAEDVVPAEEVQLNDKVTIRVRTSLPGEREEYIQQISECDTSQEALGLFLDLLCDDEETMPGDEGYVGMILGPEKFAERKAWRDIYREHGSVFFIDVVDQLLEPALERVESVKSFRQD